MTPSYDSWLAHQQEKHDERLADDPDDTDVTATSRDVAVEDEP